MRSSVNFKEIGSILASGIAGALVLTGITIILFLFGFAYRSTFVSHLYQETLAKCPLYLVFITTGGLGFLLGIIARRRLPSMKNRIILMAIFSIPLIFGAWFLNLIGNHTSMPHSTKLAECTNSVVNIHLKVPHGHGYALQLFTPGAQATTPNGLRTSSYQFSGAIRILNGGSVVAHLPISADKVEMVEGGFVLAGVDSKNNLISLGQFLQPEIDYDIEITFDPRPPPASFIQLYWLK